MSAVVDVVDDVPRCAANVGIRDAAWLVRVTVGRAATDDDVPRGTTFAARADAHTHNARTATLYIMFVFKMPFLFVICSAFPFYFNTAHAKS